MYSMSEEQNDVNQQRGIVSFDSIDWDKSRDFNKKHSILEYSNCSIQVLKKLSHERLMDLQTRYYNQMLEKESRDFFCFPPAELDEVVTVESRKRGTDNSLQFNRIMKCSKPGNCMDLLV